MKILNTSQNFHASDELKNEFSHVQNWVFDLDDTLYPSTSALFPQIRARMGLYVQKLLGVDEAEARALRQLYYREYGTTLAGLMHHHEIDPDDFLKFAHDIDHSIVKPNLHLLSAISMLKGKKFVFTNGSLYHAQRTITSLGLEGVFEDIFDIKMANYIPKPAQETYEKFFSHTGIDPKFSLMFEDLPQNLRVPKQYGMKTILIADQGEVHNELKEHLGEHIDYQINDLAGFLKEIAA